MGNSGYAVQQISVSAIFIGFTVLLPRSHSCALSVTDRNGSVCSQFHSTDITYGIGTHDVSFCDKRIEMFFFNFIMSCCFTMQSYSHPCVSGALLKGATPGQMEVRTLGSGAAIGHTAKACSQVGNAAPSAHTRSLRTRKCENDENGDFYLIFNMFLCGSIFSC